MTRGREYSPFRLINSKFIAMSVSFITKNPEQKAKLSGFAVRPDEYKGTIQIGGFEFHAWGCTLCSKADGSEIARRTLLTGVTGGNAISPTELAVDEETGYLDESVNKLQRANAKGEQNMIVRVGTGLEMPDGVGIKVGEL
jgi:hypothetical protein